MIKCFRKNFGNYSFKRIEQTQTLHLEQQNKRDMDPTLMTASSFSPQVDDLVDSFTREDEESLVVNRINSQTSIVEDQVGPGFAAEGDEDDGVRVSALVPDQHPIDPVTGQSLPPRVDPLTGKLIHARIDRESTIRNILDEEEADAEEYEEVFDEEIVAIQEPGEDEYPMPPRHTRVAEEPPSKAKQFLAQREARRREQERQQAELYAVRRNGEEQQQQVMPDVMGSRRYVPQSQRQQQNTNRPNVPDQFFQVPVDNPIEPSVRAQFEPSFEQQGSRQYQLPDHRNNFYEDRGRLDSSQPTLEQTAAFAEFSQQPHRESMDPSVPAQLARQREKELYDFAESQRNQVRTDSAGRPMIVQQTMPRVLNRNQEPVGFAADNAGFDAVDQNTQRSILPRIIPQNDSSVEDRLVEIITKVVRKEIDARLPATPAAPQLMAPSYGQQPTIFLMQSPQPQPQIYMMQPMQQQPIMQQPLMMQQPAMCLPQQGFMPMMQQPAFMPFRYM